MLSSSAAAAVVVVLVVLLLLLVVVVQHLSRPLLLMKGTLTLLKLRSKASVSGDVLSAARECTTGRTAPGLIGSCVLSRSVARVFVLIVLVVLSS